MKKFLLIMITIFILLSSCASPIVADVKQDKEVGLDYYMVEVEGMPCIVLQTYVYQSGYVKSISCDWSKWEGKIQK